MPGVCVGRLYEFSATHKEQTPVAFGEWEPSWDQAPNALGSDMVLAELLLS